MNPRYWEGIARFIHSFWWLLLLVLVILIVGFFTRDIWLALLLL